MASCVSVLSVPSVGNVVVLTGEPVELCAGGIVLSPSDYQEFQTAKSIFHFDASDFGVGFGAILFIWAIGFTVGAVLGVMRKAR